MGLFRKEGRDLIASASVVPDGTNDLTLPAGILSETIPLASVIFPDLDVSNYPVTVAEAMAVPAVSRAIALYSTIASRFVLDSTDNSTPWLTESAGFVTSPMRIARTVQDLIFHNCSLWQVERDGLGLITDAQHVARGRWTIDTNSQVRIDDKPVAVKNVIYFGGLLPGGGFLEHGRASVRQYTSIAQTINNRAAVAEPVTLVKETQESSATAEEVATAMDDLATSLTSKRGGMVYVPHGIDISGFGASDNANSMMVAARNAVRLDLANHLNINASLLEGAADGSSDTYTNTLLVQNELLELSIKGFTEPIADRLSVNDVTPNGTKILFDYSVFDTAPNDNPTDKGVVPVPTEEVTND